MTIQYTISKDYTFAASHSLDQLHALHKCARLHGHNYVLRVEVGAPALDDTSFVLDYAELSEVVQPLVDALDHRHINDVLNFPTTAENVACYFLVAIAHELLQLTGAEGNVGDAVTALLVQSGWTLRVGLSETPKTWAWAQAA